MCLCYNIHFRYYILQFYFILLYILYYFIDFILYVAILQIFCFYIANFYLICLLSVNLDPGPGHLRFNASNVIIHGMKNVDLLGYLLACNSCVVLCMSVFVCTCGPAASVFAGTTPCHPHLESRGLHLGELSRRELQASDQHPSPLLSSPPLPADLIRPLSPCACNCICLLLCV